MNPGTISGPIASRSLPSFELGAVPELTPRARLRKDPAGDGWVLLYPERGLFLNHTASLILRLCDGTRSVSRIVSELSVEHSAPSPVIQADVVAFLRELHGRGLIQLQISNARVS